MSGTKHDVVVVGGIALDHLILGNALPGPGESIVGRRWRAVPGGKGLNGAIAVSRLGGRVALIGRVGAADGARIVDVLRSEGVDTSAVEMVREARTGRALLHVSGAESRSMSIPGANAHLRPAAVRRDAELIRGSGALLVQLEIPLETVLTAVEMALVAGRTVVMDPAPPLPVPDEIFQRGVVVRSNAVEAEALTGVDAGERKGATEAGRRLVARGAGAAVIATQGGNVVVGDGRVSWQPDLPVEVVDTTGAGDAMAAALALRMSRGEGVHDAADFAVAAAALATRRLGALPSLPTLEEVRISRSSQAQARRRET